MTRIRREVDAPGQDSFLDVVANLVGILIILVMIVGTRADPDASASGSLRQDGRCTRGTCGRRTRLRR